MSRRRKKKGRESPREINDAYYNNPALAADYAARTRNTAVDASVLKLYAKLLRTFPSTRRPGRLQVADLACGGGDHAAMFAKMGAWVWAVDRSRAMLAQVEKRKHEIQEGQPTWRFADRIRTIRANLHAVPQEVIASDPLHLVWCRAGIVHASHNEVVDLANNWGIIMEPGGIIYLRHKAGNGEWVIRGGGHTQEGERRAFCLHNPKGVMRILQQAGFEDVQCRMEPDDAEPAVQTANIMATKPRA